MLREAHYDPAYKQISPKVNPGAVCLCGRAPHLRHHPPGHVIKGMRTIDKGGGIQKTENFKVFDGSLRGSYVLATIW